MRIKNGTKVPITLTLKIEGLDNREEVVAPGEESDDFIALYDGDNNCEGADVITVS